MKTLEQIKNEYAKSKGYSYWNDILLNNDEFTIDNIYVDELLILVQKECLKNASDNVMTTHHILESQDDIIQSVQYTKQSITNENNIIK